MKQRVVQVGGRRVGVAIHARAHFCEVRKIVGGSRHQLLASLRNGLAAIARFGFGNGGHVFGNQLAQLAHDLGAIGGRRGSPFWKGGFGGGHRLVDFIQAAR